jgi:hypothetical protein
MLSQPSGSSCIFDLQKELGNINRVSIAQNTIDLGGAQSVSSQPSQQVINRLAGLPKKKCRTGHER